ncbi:helix-turn-helix domain-containing protein [Deinococcus pimensis]|uniref:helix-turn-helix domain-containing protein n=1 Tax=Deinococcus pimensis TaxID=309888 RepID=UPI0004B0E3A9|nr:helix-turn-helix domain-containing protein [Deinococcus pimensis]
MTRTPSPSVWKRLDEPEAARALVDPTVRMYLTPFVWRERRVSDVARELGVTTNAVLYRVRQFLRLGLLDITREEPRAGRAVRWYRSTSRGFFVPFSATDAGTVEELYETTLDGARSALMQSLTRAWRDLADDPRWFGLYTYGDERGLLSHVVLPAPPEDPRSAPGAFGAWLMGPDAPVLWDNTYPLRLRREDAKAFQRDLYELKRRYDHLKVNEDEGDLYVVRTTIAPV